MLLFPLGSIQPTDEQRKKGPGLATGALPFG